MHVLAMLHFSPMESEAVNGRWALRYTNMPSVLGKFVGPGFRPKGEIYQDIDVPAQRMVNEQTTVLGPRNIVSSTTSYCCIILLYTLCRVFKTNGSGSLFYARQHNAPAHCW
jgi:PAP_fibrillin